MKYFVLVLTFLILMGSVVKDLIPKEYISKVQTELYESIPKEHMTSILHTFKVLQLKEYNKTINNVVTAELLNNQKVSSYEVALENGDFCRFHKSISANGSAEFSPCYIFQFADGTTHCKPHGPEYINIIDCKNNYKGKKARLSKTDLEFLSHSN
ncbi:MAG TPA: hypothetical protein DCL21_05965 [Alphaproteobacteria bacterium]|nr:hypothetical protein [Alphaproteobacteria bacterium]